MQPLGICLSYQRTMDIVRIISEDHNIEVQEWEDKLVERVKEASSCKVIFCCVFIYINQITSIGP